MLKAPDVYERCFCLHKGSTCKAFEVSTSTKGSLRPHAASLPASEDSNESRYDEILG